MIRDYVLAWASVLLVVILAFILMPTYERFKDASGKEVDVAPGAPPMPEWLKPQSGSATPAPPPQTPAAPPEQTPPPPPPPPASTAPPVTVAVDQKNMPTTVESTIPSGVKTLPSQSMPANPMLSQVGANISSDQQKISMTLPPPKFDSTGPQGIDTGYGDKYVLKSSLVPCSTGSCSKVPGGNDGMTPTAGGIPSDGISKPFSAAFSNKNEPEGYLNSFSAFMK